MGSFKLAGRYGFARADQGVGSSRLPGCYDFVRADQKGWGLLDVMGVMTLYALTRGGGIF